MDASNINNNNTETCYIQWNSHAIAQLQNGNVEGGILIFRKALSHLRNFLVENEKEEDLTGLQQQEDETSLFDCLDESDAPLLQSFPIFQSESLPGFQDNLVSYYPRMFALVDKNDNACCESGNGDLKESYSRHLVVLLYNLAMACHIEGTRKKMAAAAASTAPGGKACGQPYLYHEQLYQQSLQQALTLYKAALEITHTFWNEQDFDDLQCLLIAIVNNMGYICSEQYDFAEARSCVRLLVDLISGGNGEEGIFASSSLRMNEEDHELFFESVFTYLGGRGTEQILSIAPAA